MNKRWYFEETCPSCDGTYSYCYSEIDGHGFITCKSCGCKMHACSLCNNRDRCADCDKYDASKSMWCSDEMTAYSRYQYKLYVDKQAIFNKCLKAQGQLLDALYDDDVDAEAFKSMVRKLAELGEPEAESKPKFEDDHIYIDDAGSAWFRHLDCEYHLLRLGRFCPKDDGVDLGKLAVARKLSSGFEIVPDCLCDSFDATDEGAWDNVAKWLVPKVESWYLEGFLPEKI